MDLGAARTHLNRLSTSHLLFFFFQAEDGIRDYKVTGVQTCALPILEFSATGCVHGRRTRRNRSEQTNPALQLQCPKRSESRKCKTEITRNSGAGRAKIGRASCRERV